MPGNADPARRPVLPSPGRHRPSAKEPHCLGAAARTACPYKFSGRYETILWFTKTERYTFDLDGIRVPQKYQNKKAWRGDRKGELTCNPDGKNPGDIWLFRNVKHNHEEQTIHPCQFPEDMIARIVLCVTRSGDVVLDPYMGTGTVAVVARDHGRKFVGAETDPDYHLTAMQRLSGEPDEHGVFPNLKTLRDYCERTESPPSDYSFAVQVGNAVSPRSTAKIFWSPSSRRDEEASCLRGGLLCRRPTR